MSQNGGTGAGSGHRSPQGRAGSFSSSQSSSTMASQAVGSPGTVEYSGWLHKWTNYIHGYQKRYFKLEKHYLNYYRTDSDNSPCRGRLKMANSHLTVQSSTMFLISSGNQTFTLRAQSEIHRQRWITMLDLAKTQARQSAQRKHSEKLAKALSPSQVSLASQMTQSSMATVRGSQQLVNVSGTSPKPNTSRANGDTSSSAPVRISQRNDSQNNYDDISLAREMDVEDGSSDGSGDTTSLREKRFSSASKGDIKQILLELKRLLNTQPFDPSLYLQKSGEHYRACCTYETHLQNELREERKKRTDLEKQIEELATQHVRLRGQADFLAASPPTSQSGTIVGSYEKRGRAVSGDSGEQNSRSGTLSDDDDFEDALSDGFDFVDCEESLEENELEVALDSSPASTTVVVPLSEDLAVETTPEQSIEEMKIVVRNRRSTILPRATHSLNLWNLIKNFVGQDLSKIPMPVNFNEPLSMLQRFAEGLEYYKLLDKAATLEDPAEQMLYVLAFSMSPYSTTRMRINKPFNPLLGETFEVDRYYEDMGFRLLVEQTSHHPPAASMFVESRNGWNLMSHSTVTSKFRGNYLSVTPIGLQHIYFPKTKQHYSFDKITTTAHNIIVGKLWIDQSGEQTVWNHTTKDKCKLKYHPYSYFSRDPPRRVSGVVFSGGAAKKPRYVVTGDWDANMTAREITGEGKRQKNGQPQYLTAQPKKIWKKTQLRDDAAKTYHFTELAFQLNEPELGVAPTDCRHRQDQRLMELSHWDEANRVKHLLEESQRARRREREKSAKAAIDRGEAPPSYKANWFKKLSDHTMEERGLWWELCSNALKDWGPQLHANLKEGGGSSGATIVEDHVYTGRYWESKAKQDWGSAVNIFEIDESDQELTTLVREVQGKSFSKAVEASPLVRVKL